MPSLLQGWTVCARDGPAFVWKCECVCVGECTLHCCCRAGLCAHETDLCVADCGQWVWGERGGEGEGRYCERVYLLHPAPEPGLIRHPPSDKLWNPVLPPPFPTSASACWVTVASMPCRAWSRDRQLRRPVSRSALCSWP